MTYEVISLDSLCLSSAFEGSLGRQDSKSEPKLWQVVGLVRRDETWTLEDGEKHDRTCAP